MAIPAATLGENFILFEDGSYGIDMSGKIVKKPVGAINPFGDPHEPRATNKTTPKFVFEQKTGRSSLSDTQSDGVISLDEPEQPSVPPPDLPPAAN